MRCKWLGASPCEAIMCCNSQTDLSPINLSACIIWQVIAFPSVGDAVLAHPSQGTRWKGWKSRCGPDGSSAASPEVCRCRTAPPRPPPLDTSSCSSGHTCAEASLQFFCSRSSATTCETKILGVTLSWDLMMRKRSETRYPSSSGPLAWTTCLHS